MLCIVGDHRFEPEIRSRLIEMGLPISDEKCEQVDFTRHSVDEIDGLEWFDKRVGQQIDAAMSHEPQWVYVDWEHDNHMGFNTPVDLDSIYKLKEFIDFTRHAINVPIASWNLPGFKGKFPSSTRSSLMTAQATAKIADPDWFVVNGYIRELIGVRNLEAAVFTNRLHDNIVTTQAVADGKPVMVAWQGRLRNGAEPGVLDQETVYAWWQTVASSGVQRVLWYFRTADTDETESVIRQETDDRLDEAEWQSPLMLHAIQSVRGNG